MRRSDARWQLAIYGSAEDSGCEVDLLLLRTSDGSCHHSKAATDAARRAAQGTNESDSDSSSGGDDDGGGIDEADAPLRAGSPAGPSGAATAGVNMMKQAPQSMHFRHIVPPRAALAERASI